jgi:D-alanyl-D-alanine carboxypeptidase/D-alanyl-D-alanine-endopeptidase (penicillin-binding protein 4)
MEPDMAAGSDEFDDGQWGIEHIDLVAEPIRYPRSPLIALVLIALIPSVGFLLLHRWADSEADQYEDSRDAVELLDAPLKGGLEVDGVLIEPEEVEDDEFDVGDEPVAEPTTQLFDYRRTPEAVASVASVGQLRVAVEPVLSFIGTDSCAAVAVDGVLVASSNIDLPVIPASNQKLLVALAALDVLGADYRFTTSVALPPAREGVVDGDIYLIGGGDPLLTSDDYPIEDDRYPAINTTSFDGLVEVLVQAGVTRIRGTVIGDGTRYDDEHVIDEWADGIAFVDAGPYDALLANDSRVRGRSGRQDDPNAGAAREFVRLLGNAGIRVDNGWGNGVASTLVPVIGSVTSDPLADVLAEMLATSDNNTAEMLLKEMGVATSGEGTRAAGIDAMVASLTAQGVPMDGVVVRDGSGLSNLNRVTCAAILEVVQLGAGGPIDAGLPIAAETGTLADEFVGHPMAGRLRAKTGTLNNEPFDTDPPAVKSLAGYVDPAPTSDAGTIEFVVIANTPNVTEDSVYRPLWSALGERFATYPNGPPEDSLGPR